MSGWLGPLAMALFVGIMSPAQGQTLDDAMLRLNRALGDLRDAQIAERALDEDRLDALSATLVQFSSQAANITGEDALLMSRALEHDAELLEHAARAAPPEAQGIVDDVAQDLSVKLASGSAMGLGPRFRGAVEVKVWTRSGGRAVGGYLIGLSPARYAGSEPWTVLGQATSDTAPAVGRVAPGRYEVTAWNADGRTYREVRTVGLEAEPSVTLDLLVK